MTAEELHDLREYWTLPPKERERKFGTGMPRYAITDVITLLDEIDRLRAHESELAVGLERMTRLYESERNSHLRDMAYDRYAALSERDGEEGVRA